MSITEVLVLTLVGCTTAHRPGSANNCIISISASAGGSVSPSGDQTFNIGGGTSVSAVPLSGYRFAYWAGSGVLIVDPQAAFTSFTADGDGSLTAVFEQIGPAGPSQDPGGLGWLADLLRGLLGGKTQGH